MPAKLQSCVYVLLSMHDGNLHVGFTTDLTGLKLILRDTLNARVWN